MLVTYIFECPPSKMEELHTMMAQAIFKLGITIEGTTNNTRK